MLEAFVDLMDNLFWDGYADQLAKENPELYAFEYNEFVNTHC